MQAQGLSVWSYWAGSFVGHYLQSLLLTFALIGFIVFKKTEGLYGAPLALVACEALVFPIGLILLAYTLALFFSSVETAAKYVPLCNMFLGIIPIWLLETLPSMGNLDKTWPNLGDTMHTVFSLLLPMYGLPGMLVSLQRLHVTPTVWGAFTTKAAIPLYSSAVCFSLLAVNLIYQERVRATAKPGKAQPSSAPSKDQDVLDEEARIAARPNFGNEETVRIVNLSHTYRTRVDGAWKETSAVNGISLGIYSGECFGLLGPNGAGKTTTLSLLTGEVRPASAGSIHVCGHNVATAAGMDAASGVLGLCPQIDPLWDSLTGRQHLLFYGRIKGVPQELLEQAVDGLLRQLGLGHRDASKVTSTYSGGMKRKLSLAIALIGHCELLFLDEPSASVDAAAKRHLWKVLEMRRRDQTVLLTTHSMEEAEAMCNRIAIQVRGQLRCLGSPLHIKMKYGSGYQVELFVESAASVDLAERIASFVRERLSHNAQQLEQHAGRFLFQLPPEGSTVHSAGLTLGRIFQEVQQNVQTLGIMDYSIMQPTLEQVFLRFATV